MSMRRQAFDALVIGPVALDHLFITKGEPLAYGTLVEVKEVPVTLAGGGANTAVALARLGLKVGLVGAVGRDPRGDDVVKALAAEGVETGLMARVALAETGLGVTILPEKGKEPVLLRYRGANDLIELTEEVQKMLPTTSWLVLDRLPATWEPLVTTLLESLPDEPTRLALHPTPAVLTKSPDLLRRLLERTDVLFADLDEAKELIGGGRETAADCARALRARGVKTVVISSVRDPVHVVSEQLHLTAKPLGITVLDPRGAGDAFRAGFLAGAFHAQGDLTTALPWGVLNAASVVSTRTTQKGLLTKGVLENRLRTTKVSVEQHATTG